ncbi:MFS transporter [Patescibacteria group bacterium]
MKTIKHKSLLSNNIRFLPGETGVYVNTVLRSLGMYLVYLFIPIYVYQLTGRLESAFIFFAIYHLMVVISAVPAGWMTQKIGVDLTEFISSVFRALVLFFLILGKQNTNFLWIAGLLWGITVAFFWIPYHYTVVGAEEEDGKFGKETSLIKILEQITSSLGPFLGGLIIVSLGFNWLYSLAIILVLLSGLPLFFDKFTKKGMRFNVKKVGVSFWQKGNKRFVLAFTGLGTIDAIAAIAWPIYMFLVIKNYEVMGIIQTLSLFLGLIFLWVLGKQIDKKGSGILKWGVYVNSFIWLTRAFLKTPLTVFISNTIYGFGSLLTYTPFDALMYKSMLPRRKLEFLMMREIAIHGGGFVTCLLVWQMIKLEISWMWIFALGTLGYLVVLAVGKIIKEND